MTQPTSHAFQAEVAQLLHLVTHSLYSNPDIFLRELVSNASDACDKLRFEAMDHPDWMEQDSQLRIRIEMDAEAKTLSIIDNGIGMSSEEAIAHLGTIAKSGTREFLGALSGDRKKDSQLIGQFGVGFYSGFIVADRITVESRRAGLSPQQGVRWSSAGTGEFDVETIDKSERGTRVTLHLRDELASTYLQAWKVKQIVQKYSDHISLPIEMRKQTWDEKKGESVTTDEWEAINSANALWTRAKKDISEDEYKAFYKNLSYDQDDPLIWSHNRVEGNSEYTQLLYVPAAAPHDLWNREHKSGVKLYVRRVFIMDEAESLMPTYLRFIKGVVDSADLPLNVSRELLQESKDVRSIREGNTRRVLSMLEDLTKQEGDAYSRFYEAFGTVLKEGLGEDFGNRERIAKLLRFASTQSDSATVSLEAYKARMKEGQKAIYYITADTLAAARNSPQLEVFRKKGIEVLLMADRVDEWALSFMHEFDGVPMRSVAKGAVDLGELQDEAEKKQAEEAAVALKPLLERMQSALGSRVKSVRVTSRLVDSPACLVVEDGDASIQLAKLLKQAGHEAPQVQPILEINPDHALVKKLEAHDKFDDLAHVLLDQALLAEGTIPEDPAAYVRRVNALLV
ncbi:MAG: molecular chaperone, family [Pseudomonadota bacterium]|jgi:molecular chaperone HtpG